MRLLLDTHFVYWAAIRLDLLSTAEIDLIGQAEERVISAVSFWELRLKWDRFHPSGTRKGPVDPADLLDAVTRGSFTLLPLSLLQAVTVLATPIEHRDPFDELLLAQAQAEGLRLLTRDRALLTHPLALGV